jgi:hypothetical protein
MKLTVAGVEASHSESAILAHARITPASSAASLGRFTSKTPVSIMGVYIYLSDALGGSAMTNDHDRNLLVSCHDSPPLR